MGQGSAKRPRPGAVRECERVSVRVCARVLCEGILGRRQAPNLGWRLRVADSAAEQPARAVGQIEDPHLSKPKPPLRCAALHRPTCAEYAKGTQGTQGTQDGGTFSALSAPAEMSTGSPCLKYTRVTAPS